MNSNGTLLSVIIPVYNTEKYIKKCLESIVAQSYTNTEIIIIDDGSDDRSYEICKSFADRDERIILLRQENKGAVATRKRELEYSKGQYVVFVDADDWIEENAFSGMMAEIDNTQNDFVAFGYYQNNTLYCYKENRECCPGQDKVSLIKEYFWDTEKTERITRHSIWSKIYRREFILDCFRALPDDVQLGEDMLCYTHCLLKTKRFALCNEAYYHYNVADGSLSHKSDIGTIKDYTKLYDAMCDLYKEYDVYEALRFNIEAFCLSNINRVQSEYIGFQQGIITWQFPHKEDLQGMSVYIYGAGNVGKAYLLTFQADNRIEVNGLVDKNRKGECIEGITVCSPEDLIESDNSYVVVIAIKDEIVAKEAMKELIMLGISKERLIWKSPVKYVNSSLSEWLKKNFKE